MNDYVINPDFRVLTILAGLAGHQGRTWCNPYQKTLLRLIGQFTQRLMSRRTLLRHLGALVRDNWIERINRHQRLPSGELDLRASAYVITLKAQKWLGAMRRSVGRMFTAPPNTLTLLAVPDWAHSLDTDVSIYIHTAAIPPPKQ